MNIDGSEGVNQVIYDNRGALTGGRRGRQRRQILGFAPVPLYYEDTGGIFDSPANDPFKGSGILLRGSTTARDAFFAQNTPLAARLPSRGAAATFTYVAALPPVPVVGGPTFSRSLPTSPTTATSTRSAAACTSSARWRLPRPLYVNDHGNTQARQLHGRRRVVQELRRFRPTRRQLDRTLAGSTSTRGSARCGSMPRMTSASSTPSPAPTRRFSSMLICRSAAIRSSAAATTCGSTPRAQRAGSCTSRRPAMASGASRARRCR